MKTLSAAIQSHLALEVQGRVTCWCLIDNWRRTDVAAITLTDPAVVETDQAHALSTGMVVAIQGGDCPEVTDDIHGTWRFWTVTVTDDTHFELDGADATGWTAYTTGAVVRRAWGYTDAVEPVTADGLTYQAEKSYTRTSVPGKLDGSVPTAEVEGALASAIDISLPGFLQAEILVGALDYAEVRMFQLIEASPSSGKIPLLRGWLGTVTTDNGRYTAELRGLADILNSNVLELYSATCRYQLGDTRCTVDLSSYRTSGTVTAVAARDRFTDAGLTEADGYFVHGVLRWVTGDNAGLQSFVRGHASDVIQLADAAPYTIQVGDTYVVTAGCAKNPTDCKDKFSNLVNYGGFPHVPGQDLFEVVTIPRPSG